MIIEVEDENEELLKVSKEPKDWITQLCIYFDSGRLPSILNAS